MLSDLASVFANSKIPIVLGGDWNISTQGAKSQENEAAAVFARLRAWRLVDAIAHTRDRRVRASECNCPDRERCAHTQTYRHLNRAGGFPTQLDYLFVSERLIPKLECRVVNDDEAVWALSDHCPIYVDIEC
jgi:exonuclease III